MASITGTDNGETLTGTADADLIEALAGADTVNAQGGADEVHGGDGADALNGGDGDDTLHGEGDKDTLRGDAGDDRLIGGAGQDRLFGGSGNDVFVFESVTDSTVAAQDFVLDFVQGQDRIDLGGLLGALDLAWGGTSAVAYGAWYWQFSTYAMVYVDVDGDAVADSRIQLNGQFALTAGDFLGVVQPVTVPPPEPVNDDAAVSEDVVLSATGNVLANDAGEGPLAVTAVGFGAGNGTLGVALAGVYGSLILNADGTYTYQLNNGSPGVQALGDGATVQDVFTYTVSNGGGSATATLTLTITGTHDNPAVIGGSASGSVTEDTVLTAGGTLSVSDPDPGDAAFQSQNGSAGTYGTFGIEADGDWSYALDNGDAAVQSLAAGQVVTDSFTVTSVDASATQTVVVTIHGSNDAPTLIPSTSVQTTVGVAVGGAASGSDADTGAVLSYSATQGAHGVVSIDASAGTWTYAPAAGFAGNDSFTITVTDGEGGSAQQTVDVGVSLVINRAPTLSGVVLTALGPGTNEDVAHDVTVLGDGRMLAAGYAQTASGGNDFALVRYNADGTLDTTFGGGDGTVTTAIGPGTNGDLVNEVAVQPDGRIVVAGYATTKAGGLDFAVARYNGDGTLDTSFGGGDGIVTTPIGSGTSTDVGHSMTVLADGRILLGGFAQTSNGADFALVRYNAGGTLDTSFGGGDGIVTTPISSGSGGDIGHALTVQADGRIVVGGFARTSNGGNDFALVRYNANGSIDTSFGGGDGRVTTTIGPGSNEDWGYDVTMQTDGRILLSGFAQTAAGGNDFALVRYNADGTIDTSFGGGDGMVTTAIGPGAADDRSYAMTLQPDGRILVLGYGTTVDGGQDIALVRYNADGSVDTGFGGGDGLVTAAIGPGTGRDVGHSVHVLDDGRILVVGSATTAAGGSDLALLRFNADGSPDTTFGGLAVPAVHAGSAFSFALPAGLFADADGDSLAYSLTGEDGTALPSWLSFDAATRTLAGAPPVGAPDLALRLVATDPLDATGELSFTLRINDRPTDVVWNAAPPPGDTSLPGSRAILATLGVADSDGAADAHTWSLVSGNGVTISESGVVARTSGLATNTSYTIVVRVTDSQGASFEETFNVITGTSSANNPMPSNGAANAVLSGDDILYGLGGNDVMHGGDGDDTLFAQAGNDTLHGGAGDDVLNGGAGNDAFVFADGFGQDRIVGFTAGGTDDSINLSAVTNPDWTSFADVQAHMTQAGADTLVDVGGGNSITLVGVTATSLTPADFVL